MNDKIKTSIDSSSKLFKNNREKFLNLIDKYKTEEEEIKLGGGTVRIQKQHDKGRMTARERVAHLITGHFFEIGLYAGYKMYEEVGDINAVAIPPVPNAF